MEQDQARIPKYIPIRDAIAHDIESGVLEAHAKLPSERELSEQFQTTRVAAREALLALETDGLIYRLDRRGWYVRSPRIIYHPQSTKNFNQFVIEQGYEPSTEVISSELTQATSWDAKHLKVEKGHPIYSVWRRRCINGRPVLVEHLRVNAELFPEFLTHDLKQSITLLMANQYNCHITRADINLYPTALSEQQAKALHVNVGALGLYICRSNRNEEGVITDVDQEYWLHDVLDLHFEARA
ncbi:UTRA domain-containing protein [Acinetobacter baumannii]|jgi:DNA-binding GntR family transcriptional regulator|uniref:UTRA domain-containing protein n=1 Tax=Acinetobacter baumannii TaxID=470 RepID=UPI0006170601|nr:UTRA domain-containing protein [Acinetobacter baumannii]KMV24649.1 bacterial regulatory s, gntR family protein [Acinetobacter baumannii]MBD0492476.1 UTRA domain-containing protein [Acinetobacter baumannii]MBF9262984.1 UTRA domain-containing protein [Acinetobacter baumannii]MCW3181027.1 UTRA domain-containing protein [Acinetobacter baumannii]MCZ3106973.1 UTRA domain-containing protein [Acinetobacter baumannii]